jgi:hypothetical protein
MPEAATVIVRQATPGDAAARCELFAGVSMETDLVLSVRRDPDFDLLYRLQSADWESWVVEVDGRIEGMGTILVRDGYVGGERRRVGYLGDLRFSSRAEGRLLIDRLYGPLLDAASARFRCDAFLTTIITSNARAVRALTVRNTRSVRSGRPVYTPLMDFDIRSLHLLTIPRCGRASRGIGVRRAGEQDVPAIARLLDDDGRRRPFGYPMEEIELRRRLATWPGLSIESFYVAESARGELLGTIALWDATPAKRMIVREYRRGLRRVRLAYDLAARLLRRPRLPAPGDQLRYAYVTHQAVRDDDPRVLQSLLRSAARERRDSGEHFLSICAPADGVVDAATRGFFATNLAARLFVVTAPGRTSDPSWFSGRPGFEMALV